MHIQTKFLRLSKAVSLGDGFDGWRICWVGRWDKCRVFFVVMVVEDCVAGRVHAGIERR